MIKRVKIKGYKSLHDLEIYLEPLTVIIGPNAAGKSNFLDALQLLPRIVTHRSLKEAFEPPYRGRPLESFTFGEEGIKSLLKKDSAVFSIEVDVELSPVVIDRVNQQIAEMKHSERKNELKSDVSSPREPALIRDRYLRYRLEVEIRPKYGLLLVSDEFLAAIKKNGELKASRNPFLERIGEKIHLRMEGQAHPIYYERFLDYSILSQSLFQPHYPHIVALQQEISNWFFYYFEPRERMRLPSPVREVRHPGMMCEELASFLNTLKSADPQRFEEMGKSLNMIIPSVTGIEVEVTDSGEAELKVVEDGIPFPARVLSEGTLRVLGLLALWGGRERPSVVGFEEPENGIPPSRVKRVAELLKNRAGTGSTQLIVTTHSPLVPEMLPDENIYICRKLEGKTIIEPIAHWGPLSRKAEIEKALNAEDKNWSSHGERIISGDYDA
jgi:predicted ATPase